MECENPLVTVIIPTYNRARMVTASIKSVLKQTYVHLEIIVVDDGSIDDTKRVVASIEDRRIKYLCHAKNKGAPAARNTGISNANGLFTAFLDSDDIWDESKIERQVALLGKADSDVGMVYTGIREVDTEGRIVKTYTPRKSGQIYDLLLKRNIIGSTSTPLVRTSVLQNVGGFDERFPAKQDLDLWLRIAKEYKVLYISDPLISYLVHSDRITENYDKRIQASLMIMEKFWADINKSHSVRAEQYYRFAKLCYKKDKKMSLKYFAKPTTLICKPEAIYHLFRNLVALFFVGKR